MVGLFLRFYKLPLLMQPITKDILRLMVTAAGAIFIFVWPMLYPYIGSLLHYQNSDLTLKYFFSLSVFIFVGIFAANYFLPKLYFLIGIKRVFYVMAILQIIDLFCFLRFTSTIGISFNFFLCGIIQQMNQQTVTFYLSEKYQGGYIYGSQALMGQNLFIITWPIIASRLINPQNLPMVQYQTEDGLTDMAFSQQISNRLYFFIFIYGIVSTLLIILGSLPLEDPDKTKAHFFIYIKALFNRNNQQLEELDQTFNTTKSYHNIDQSISIDNVSLLQYSIQKSQKSQKQDEEELVEGEIINIEQEARQISQTNKFRGLIIFSSNIQGQIYYFIDNYKYLALLIIKDDKACTIAFSISAFFNLLSKYLTPYIWAKFGFYGTYALLNTLMIILYIGFFFSFQFPVLILILVDLARFNIGLSSCLNQLAMFGLFNSHVALRLSKLYDSNYLIGFIVAIFFNYICVDENHLSLIFYIFLFIMIVNLILFTKYYRNYQSELNGNLF